VTAIRALIFDLDDTLYPERSYVESGFRAVAGLLAERTGGDHDDYFAFMSKALANDGRGRIFDDLMTQYPNLQGHTSVGELVEHYRHHRPVIQCYPGVEKLLHRLRQTYRLAIVTDGLGVMQRRKVQALKLVKLVDEIIYCWELKAPKPDTAGFERAMERLQSNPNHTIVIGDRPDHDLQAAIAIGCRCIRIRSDRFATQATPEHPLVLSECSSVVDIEGRLS